MPTGDYLSVLSHGLIVTSSGGGGDFPVESDVRENVEYNDGALTGTLVVPSASDVKEGVVFDNGTVGTYVAQFPAPTGTGFSKARDYLLQTAPITLLYLVKTTEGSSVFNSPLLSVFTAHAKQVSYVVKSGSQRGAEDGVQVESCVFNMWRTPWLVNHAADRLPALGDKMYYQGYFWLATKVDFFDLDDSGYHQRFRVEVQKSNKPVL